MGLFSRFFGAKNKIPDPVIQFGRYSDTYKDESKYKNWEKAMDTFENEKYLECYSHLLDFLSDDRRHNVSYVKKRGKLTFTIYQGSKVIHGEADHKKLYAEARIVMVPQPSLGLMRKVLEENFELRYARFTLDENHCLCLRFDTFVEDGSPHKIYQALRELATHADRKDDVLIHEFDGLKPIDSTHTRPVSAQEKRTKYRYFHNEAVKVLEEIDSGKLNGYLYPGGISFLLLDYLYRIDYLVKPEGNTMETILDCNQLFFNDNMVSVHEKNREIISRIRQFVKVEYSLFSKEIYEVNSTFGISMPEGHQRFVEIVDAQLTDFDWYYQNKHLAYANAICGYVVGYALYSFALPEPTRDFLKLYYMISENEYFISLGFGTRYLAKGLPLKHAVIDSIRDITKSFAAEYPDLNPSYKSLQYDDMNLFGKSYLMMVRDLNYNEDI